MDAEIKVETVKLSAIAVHPGLQQRANGTDRERVQELLAVLVAGQPFKDRLVVFKPKKGKLILPDGFHRHAAYVAHGAETVEVEVHPGEYADALRYSLGANRDHGTPRSKDDLHKAAVTALTDATFADLSLRKLASEVLYCDPSWLSKLAREVRGTEPDPVKSEAAKKGNAIRRGEEEQDDDTPDGDGAGEPQAPAPWGSAAADPEPEAIAQRDEIGAVIPPHALDGYNADPHAFAKCLFCHQKANPKCEFCHGKSYMTEPEFKLYEKAVKELPPEAEPDPIKRAMAARKQFEEAVTLTRKLSRLLDTLCSGYGGYFLRNLQTRARAESSGMLEPLFRLKILNEKAGTSRYESPELLSLFRALRSAKPKHACPHPVHKDGFAEHAECSSQGFVPESPVLRNRPDAGVQLEAFDGDPWDDVEPEE